MQITRRYTCWTSLVGVLGASKASRRAEGILVPDIGVGKLIVQGLTRHFAYPSLTLKSR